MADLKRAVKKLVEEFKEANAWTKSEEDVQASFTIALLRKLGWGPANWQVNTGTEVRTGKKPDIVLKDDAGFTVLVIESKAPKRELGVKTHEEQLYRYCGYEGKYWGILTNFVEWRVYTCHLKREYKKYAFCDLLPAGARRDEYTDLLSEEGLAFLAFLERDNLCAKHGRFSDEDYFYPDQEEIRDEFFNKLRDWRKKLRAELYKKYGKKYGKDEVDLGTQKILDRLIFIEVCTDKEILAGDVLESVLTADGRFYRVLKSQFERMDELFDTELFAYHWVDDASVPDKVIEPIIRGVAEVDFRLLPVHVIGEVYEDYLGELVREKGRGLTAKSPKATRKAKGIYYTPDYIVDYIVTNTVGELLKKAKTEDDIKKIRVLDPACGSGSFLIRAFDEFAAAYERVLNKKGTAPLFGFDVKRSILENNLYGVDIDPRAVEIAKLNLMIKALEGTKYQDLKGRKLLPNLSLNIRCGNSLVSGDEAGDKEDQLAIFGADHEADAEELILLREKFYGARDDEEKEHLLTEIAAAEYNINEALNEGLHDYFDDPAGENPFNYTVAFPEVFRAGGFDALIGNPPYLNLTVGTTGTDLLGYYNSKYDSFRAAQSKNSFAVFIERVLGLQRKKGLFSFIVPEGLARTRSYKKVREIIDAEGVLKKILVFDQFVFKEAYIGSLVFVISKNGIRGPYCVERLNKDLVIDKRFKKDYSYLKASPDLMWSTEPETEGSVLANKIRSIFPPAETAFSFYKGMAVKDRKNHLREIRRENDLPFLLGNSLKRYYLEYKNFTSYDELTIVGGTKVLSKHLECPRLLVRRTGDFLCVAFTEEPQLVESTVYIVSGPERKKLLYYLGAFNSKLLTFIVRQRMITNPQAFPQILMTDLKELPVKPVNNSDPADVARHDKMVALVEEMLELHKRLAAAKSDADKQRLQRAIAATDRKIDNLVYELYGLTDEEIKIIEST